MGLYIRTILGGGVYSGITLQPRVWFWYVAIDLKMTLFLIEKVMPQIHIFFMGERESVYIPRVQ